MHGFQLWANLPSSLKMTAPRYQDITGARHPGGHRRRRHARARRVRRLLGQEGPGRRRRRRSALSRRLRAARASARRSRSKTTRHAFAYVFAGIGTFRDASEPLGVLTEAGRWPTKSSVRDESRQPLAGAVRPRRRDRRAGRRRGHPLPAGVGQAARGAGGLVRPDRDEHAGGAAAGRSRTARRHVHQGSRRSSSQVSPRPAPIIPASVHRQHFSLELFAPKGVLRVGGRG